MIAYRHTQQKNNTHKHKIDAFQKMKSASQQKQDEFKCN